MEDCLGRVKIKVCEMWHPKGRSKKVKLKIFAIRGRTPHPMARFSDFYCKSLKIYVFNPSQFLPSAFSARSAPSKKGVVILVTVVWI